MCSSLCGTPLSQPRTPALQGTILHRSGIALPAAPAAPQDWGYWDKGELSGNCRTNAVWARQGLQGLAGWGSKGWGGAGALANTYTVPVQPWPCRVEPGPGHLGLKPFTGTVLAPCYSKCGPWVGNLAVSASPESPVEPATLPQVNCIKVSTFNKIQVSHVCVRMEKCFLRNPPCYHHSSPWYLLHWKHRFLTAGLPGKS